MKTNSIICLILSFTFISCKSVKINRNQENNLVGTEWLFVGFQYKSFDGRDTLKECPKEYGYVLRFTTYSNLTGTATLPFSGRYILRPNNMISFTGYIPTGYVTKMPKEEFEWRMNFVKQLQKNKRTMYAVKNDHLIINADSDLRTVFKRTQ